MVEHPLELASHGWVVRAAAEAETRTFVVGCDTDDEAVAQVRSHATMADRPRIAALRRLDEDEVDRLALKKNEVRPYEGA